MRILSRKEVLRQRQGGRKVGEVGEAGEADEARESGEADEAREAGDVPCPVLNVAS